MSETPSDLLRRIRTVLLQLSMLGDGATTNLNGKIRAGKSETKAPPGVGQRHASLFNHYRTRFAQATSYGQLWKILYEAERDYEEWTTGLSESRIAGRPERTDERKFAALVVAEYAGATSARVAVIERVKVGWVEKVRVEAGRDPDNGLKRPDFKGADEDGRRQIVAQFAGSEAWTPEQIARHLGTSRRSVKRYWPALGVDAHASA